MARQPVTARECLVAARKLIERPAFWSGDGSGLGVGKNCAVTALCEVAVDGVPHGLIELRVVCKDSVANFNDTHSHGAVLELFDQAIASLPLDRETVS